MQRRTRNPEKERAAADYSAEILREQFEYLLDHAGEHCDPFCTECRRFERIRGALLLSFEVTGYEVPHPPKKAKVRARARRANA